MPLWRWQGCDVCGDTKATLKCSSCRRAVYCDAVCQKAGWAFHKHCCNPRHAAAVEADDAGSDGASPAKPPSAAAFLDRVATAIADPTAPADPSPPPPAADGGGGRDLVPASVAAVREKLRLAGWPVQPQLTANGRGWGLVATRAIPAGSAVLEDDPVAAVPQGQYRATICHRCFRMLPASAAVPCRLCATACWCSQGCAAAAGMSHVAECAVLQQFAPQARAGLHGVRLFVLLATSTGPEKATVGAPEFRDRAGPPGSPAHAKLLQMATGIAQALPAEHKPAVSAADLVDYICAVKANGFFVSDIEGRRLASAYYGQGRFFNHSCDPNAIVGFIRGVLHVRAMRAIRPGDEVLISYTELYRPVRLRHDALDEKKGFRCGCPKCLTDAAAPLKEIIGGYTCAKKGCPGHAVSSPDGSVACPLCGTARPETAATLAALEFDTGAARERAGDEMGQRRLESCTKMLERALKATDGKLHPLHYERFECHVMLTDALSQIRPLPRQRLYTQVRLALHCMEQVYSDGEQCLSPRAGKMYRLLGDCFAASGPLGHTTTLRPECAAAAYQCAIAVLRAVWGAQHDATLAMALLIRDFDKARRLAT